MLVQPGPSTGLQRVAAASLLADNLNPGCADDCAGLLNFLGIEPLRDPACFLEFSKRALNTSRPSPNRPGREVGALKKAFRSRSGKIAGVNHRCR